MTSMEQYTDPMTTPVNIEGCYGVMGAVSQPYTQECVVTTEENNRVLPDSAQVERQTGLHERV